MNAAPDLGPAARRLGDLVAGAPDDRLAAPTPCAEYTVGDLIDHIGGLALGFTYAATKSAGEGTDGRPSGDASRLGDAWRTEIPQRLGALADAWRDPAAWTGMTQAGGVKLPGEVAGMFALDELVVHGWDLARAIGRPYEPAAAEVEACLALLTGMAGQIDGESPFGPPVRVPDAAPPLDRLVGLTGRDPAWTPSAA
ncbi:TIGR03086 family metal-binding protein [Actinomadura sp. NPDC047616]|uniref:TIGR03086 family metal-binding protein n=1 Tax=Actinomadura sp. NPDC047616 TaxID=3155914 RepID=UPI0033C675F5